MRLICPNCDAQYEVGEGVIPAEGRDVQCSNCGHTWFQYPDGYDDRPVEELEDDRALTTQAQDHFTEAEEDDFETSLRAALDENAEHADAASEMSMPDDVPTGDDRQIDDPAQPEHDPFAKDDIEDDDADITAPVTAAAAAARAVRRELPDDITEILRAEAQRESEARSNEPKGELETQSDLGLDRPGDDDDQRARKARRRLSQFNDDDEGEGDLQPGKASRRNALPDIEDINSTLRATTDRKRETAAAATEPAQKSRSRRAGFRTGFYLMIFAAIVLGMVYVMAPQIVEAVPMSEPYVSIWVTFADQMRWVLDDLIRAAVQKITELTG